MAEARPKSKLLDFLLIFALVTIASQIAVRFFFPDAGTEPAQGVMLHAQDASLRTGQRPMVVLQNNTQEQLTLQDRCPRPPFDIFFTQSDGILQEVTTGEPVIPCEPVATVPPGESVTIDLSPWITSSFAREGTYVVKMPVDDAASGSGEIAAQLTISEPGAFVKLFRALITKPFLNFLILMGSVLPGHSLAAGIIILTLLVKLLLFIPTQHALEGQKKMQLMQPKIDELRTKYANDPQKLQMETMKLWKEHGVNPFQSCLPLLLQFPVLIGLLYVIQEGTVLSLAGHLIYPTFQDIDWQFNTNFFGLDLTAPNLWLFPPLLVVLQFLQLKLSFHIAERKKKDVQKHEEVEKKVGPSSQDIQQKVMLYVLPLMIGFFALRFPAAVALYWGVSTVFAIGQQMIVNREHLKV